MKVLEWPTVDLKQIEILLHELNQPVHAGKPSSVAEFKTATLEEETPKKSGLKLIHRKTHCQLSQTLNCTSCC